MYIRPVLWATLSFQQYLLPLFYTWPTLFPGLPEIYDRWDGQYSLQSDFVCLSRSFPTLYLPVTNEQKEGSFYQNYVSSSQVVIKGSIPDLEALSLVCRDLINGHVKIKPNKQIFHRCN